MENLPHLVIEGMIIAGLVTGAQKGILYIRHEYEAAEDILQEEIERCYEAAFWATRCSAQICRSIWRSSSVPAATSAAKRARLLEAIEGKRAEPRNKPPFPGHARRLSTSPPRSTMSRRSPTFRRSWCAAWTGTRRKGRAARRA